MLTVAHHRLLITFFYSVSVTCSHPRSEIVGDGVKQIVQQYGYLFLDRTSYNDEELSARNMNEVPRPFVQESTELFKGLSLSEKRKLFFVHFNHTDLIN